MKKDYRSPQIEVVKLTFSTSILNISEGESGASGGFIEDPGEEEP